MAKSEAIFIGGSVAVGAAILGALFLLYPDFMFGPSASSSEAGIAGADTTLVSPQDETTMTAGETSATGNSTNNTATDPTAPYGLAP
ncbi:MAG: hypothetical protein AB1351_13315 [Thermoproteota archaeon]